MVTRNYIGNMITEQFSKYKFYYLETMCDNFIMTLNIEWEYLPSIIYINLDK